MSSKRNLFFDYNQEYSV